MIFNYILCFVITMLTIDAMSVGDILYDMSWYDLPRYDQFIVQMIILRSQVPFELKGLGVFVCSLETYLNVNVSFVVFVN